MPSQFFGLNIGASALSAFQTSVNTAANNVANVQTKGYTRQTANLSATDPIRVYTRYGSVGTGVEVTSVTQERNLYYDEKYWQNQILNCCKLLENDIILILNTIYFHLAKMYLNTRAILIFCY